MKLLCRALIFLTAACLCVFRKTLNCFYVSVGQINTYRWFPVCLGPHCAVTCFYWWWLSPCDSNTESLCHTFVCLLPPLLWDHNRPNAAQESWPRRRGTTLTHLSWFVSPQLLIYIQQLLNIVVQSAWCLWPSNYQLSVSDLHLWKPWGKYLALNVSGLSR